MRGLAIANIVILGMAWLGMLYNAVDGSTSSESFWGFVFTVPMMVFAILYLVLKK
jgi:hypothetical protein